MYQKPALQRFGTFRELTRLGTDADGDGGIYGAVNGCNWIDIKDCGS
jgi:hypothetical protein